MKPIEQKTAAKQFAAYWATRGDEKQDTQSFWLSLLRTPPSLSSLRFPSSWTMSATLMDSSQRRKCSLSKKAPA